MNILLLGGGGREHALADALASSANCEHLFIAPGNAGTATLGENVPLSLSDFPAIEAFATAKDIALIVVGPEAPLAAGITDYFQDKPVKVLGPAKAGATLESSKQWSKAFMQRHKIPTASARSFTAAELNQALDYVDQQALPVVVKASGLAAGKGVLICEDHASAKQGVRDMLTGGAFGASGETVVIEAFLKGIELSVFILTDGKDYVLLPEAKDYKRIGEGDTGLNTGGMGAVSPVPFADESFLSKVKDRIIQPTLQGLQEENIPYCGFLFIGLMNVDGDPFVIEYNVRLGDPEAEVILPRIDSDFLELCQAAVDGSLATQSISINPQHATTVMLVSGGYPGKYEKGKVITGLEQVGGAKVYQAGTKRDSEGALCTNGGRVLCLTALADHTSLALETSLSNAEKVEFEGKYFRRDIGKDLLELQ